MAGSEQKPGVQEYLFVSPSVVETSSEFPAVSLIEHDMQLLNVLMLFGEIHNKEWMIRNPNDIKRRYPEDHERVLKTTALQRRELEAEAEAEFMRSIGLFALQDSESYKGSAQQDLLDAKRRWMFFQLRYRSPKNSVVRALEIQRLSTSLEARMLTQSQFNRDHDLRLHASNKSKVRRTPEQDQPELCPLSTPERLVAIAEDPRAGFLPTTNREKNQVLAYLDYLDNPRYPLGITNQMAEVFIHQQKHDNGVSGLEQARQASVSIPYEIGDYLHDATTSIEHLRQLQADIALLGSNRFTLGEEIGDYHIGYGALVRYRDLSLLRKTSKQPAAVKDALLTREDRSEQADPQKHKQVGDNYTASFAHKDMQVYVATQAQAMRLSEAIKLVRAAIADQQCRAQFMRTRLEDFTRTGNLARSFQSGRVASYILNKTLEKAS